MYRCKEREEGKICSILSTAERDIYSERHRKRQLEINQETERKRQ